VIKEFSVSGDAYICDIVNQASNNLGQYKVWSGTESVIPLNAKITDYEFHNGA
jgi:hypothetical protein